MAQTKRVTEAGRIRVALAFVALRHKPKDKSYAAYVSDLHDQFPLTTKRKQTSDVQWRDRALKFEDEVNSLKRKNEALDAELKILREIAHPDISGKKKRKLNPAVERREGSDASTTSPLENIDSRLRDMGLETSGPELSNALSLFGSYHKLFHLSSALRPQSAHSSQLILSATNVLRALAKALHPTLGTERTQTTKLMHKFSMILCSTLSCTMTLIPSAEASSRKTPSGSTRTNELLDMLFTVLASDVVIPLLKAFARLSESIYLLVLGAGRQQQANEGSERLGEEEAVLPGLLVSMRAIIAIIRKEVNVYGRRLLEVIKLGVVTEIERLWTPSGVTSAGATDFSPPNSETTPSAEPCLRPITKLSREERTRRLGRKTALWYLCAIARDVFTPVSALGPEDVASEFTRHRLDVGLSRLLVRCSNPQYAIAGLESSWTSGMSDIERGMILSVIENIWLSE